MAVGGVGRRDDGVEKEGGSVCRSYIRGGGVVDPRQCYDAPARRKFSELKKLGAAARVVCAEMKACFRVTRSPGRKLTDNLGGRRFFPLVEFNEFAAPKQGNTGLCEFPGRIQIAVAIVVSGDDSPFRKQFRDEVWPWNLTIPVIKRSEKALDQRFNVFLFTKIGH